MGKERLPSKNSVSKSEKAGRIYRDFNIIGAVALGGAAIIAPPLAAGALTGLAGLNAVQAAGGEWFRRRGKRKRLQQGS